MRQRPSPKVSWAHLRHFGFLWALLSVEFFGVYCGADWLTVHRVLRFHAYTTSELAIPLIPAMVLPYMTMYTIFLLAPFVIRRTDELDRLAVAVAQVIAIAGLLFLIFPAEIGFPPATVAGSVWNSWLHLAQVVSLKYNLVPSLHVALFTVCAGAYAAQASLFWRVVLGIWLVTVAASTVLTHQHHLLDVGSGLALGAWGAWVAARVGSVGADCRIYPEILSREGSGCSQ